MKRCRILTLVAAPLVAIIAGCELADPQEASGADVCSTPFVQRPLPPELAETSGIAASREHAGVFWTHNDSGGEPAVFAVDSAGTVLGRVRLAGATNRDWEDIAVGPCEPDGPSCIFVADIGDNNERHDRIAIYRVPEPDPRRDTVSRAVSTLRARYPDGPRDAEALYVTSGGIHIINKGRSHAIELFRLAAPYSTERTAELQRVQQVAPPPTSVSAQVTAAAVSPDQRHVVVRSYAGLRFFQVQGDTLAPWGRAADLLAQEQTQGEGVDWIDADHLVLTSEAQGQQPPTIAVIRCQPDSAADPAPPVPDSGAAPDPGTAADSGMAPDSGIAPGSGAAPDSVPSDSASVSG